MNSSQTRAIIRNPGLPAIADNRLLWVVLAVLATLVLNMANDPLLTARSLTDPDNATRIVQVNALLSGASWYDLRLDQIGLPDPLVSHWSRVVDAPLAALFTIERYLTGDSTADTGTRYIWPVILMAVMFGLVARETERFGGTRATVILLFLAATSTFATFQFTPGRIDHHNLQIIGAAGGLIVLYRALHTGHGAMLAGALLGFGLVIGFEAMPLVVAVVGLTVLITALIPRHLPTMARTMVSLASTLTVGLALNQAPWHWLTPACDALGLNLVALAAIGALTLAGVVRHGAAWSLAVRLGILAAGGGVAISVYVWLNPACAAGPMAAVDPAIRPIWLVHVREGMSLFKFAAKEPAPAIVYVIILVGAFGLVSREWLKTRSAADALAVAAIGLAGIYCTIFIKFFPYAVWLALPVFAVAIARLGDFRSIPQRTVHLAAAMLVSHGTLLVLISSALGPVTGALASTSVTAEPRTAKVTRKTIHCDVRSDIAKLRALPPGRIMNGIDLGPYIAADTEHRVLVGPYHRLDAQIVAWHRILSARVEEGVSELRAGPYDYIVLCAQPPRRSGPEPKSLRGYLSAGHTHPALEPIPIGKTERPLRAWRIVRLARERR